MSQDLYAIIQLAGKQHRVAVGEKIVVDAQIGTPDEKLKISDVLLVAGKEVKIGQPLVAGAAVELKVVSHQRGEKIRVATYRAKSRFRKVKGHRQDQTTLEVVAING